MKRVLISVAAIAGIALFGSISLHAQAPKIYTNSKPVAFGYTMKNYYAYLTFDLKADGDATPDDKFFAHPPGWAKENQQTSEQESIGAEEAHAADTMFRMCSLIAGQNPAADSLPGTVAMAAAMPTKAAVMDALDKSIAVCDPLVDNFNDANVTALVNSQNALQPLGTALFNVISHNREVYGRIRSFMISEGIKAPREKGPGDPNNPMNLYYCGATMATGSKTIDNCTSK